MRAVRRLTIWAVCLAAAASIIAKGGDGNPLRDQSAVPAPPPRLSFSPEKWAAIGPARAGFPSLNGPYLGQKKPGPTPEIFAPGIVSLGFHEHNIAISPDGKEIFFVAASSDFSRYLIMTTRLETGGWTMPEVAPFSGGRNDGAPAFSPDGKRLYFSSRRPHPAGKASADDFDIWYVDRRGDSWTDPMNLGGPVNRGQNEVNPSVTSDGTLYFQRIEKLGTLGWDLYVSYSRNGTYTSPERLPAPVNTDANEAGPFIAADGNYLIFQSDRPGGYGIMDLYATYRAKNGGWSEPANLGDPINSQFSDWGPAVSPDGKYLFFGSFRKVQPIASESLEYFEYMTSRLGTPSPGRGTLYWVEANVIDTLSPKGPARCSVAPHERTIAVIGSSVAAGWVTAREAGQDMKNGWAFRLARHLEPLGYKVVHVSVPGDTTEKVLARLDKDLLSLQPDFAVISLSLENEGIRGIGGRDPRKVYEGFGTNLRRIIAECRERNIVPVVASCYANDNFGDPATYGFIVDMNLEMASWGVPIINFLGALDRGDGRFVQGLTFDLDHPADRGHRELFLSIVPGLFEALAAGKPAPERDSGPGSFSTGTAGRSGTLSCVPADPMHSFTALFEIRASGPGIAAAIRGEGGKLYRIAVAENGDAVLHASAGAVQRIRATLLDGNWHRIGWVYHYLRKEMTLSIDGKAGPSIPEAIRTGRLLPGSLEVFAPLRRGKPGVDSEVENRAQSASRVVFMPRDIRREIARLETAIARLDREEVVYIDPNEKKPVFVAPGILAAWEGVYEIAPGLVLTIVMEEGRLFLLVNGGDDGKTELFPLSAERFFVKSVGPQMEISFQAEKGGQPTALVFKVAGQEMKGTRKESKAAAQADVKPIARPATGAGSPWRK